MNEGQMLIAVLGLVVLSVVTRSAFFLTERAWRLPHWLASGLKYAPLAALAAVVAPELVLTQGHFLQTWRVRADPNLSHRADPILSQGW